MKKTIKVKYLKGTKLVKQQVKVERPELDRTETPESFVNNSAKWILAASTALNIDAKLINSIGF